MKKCISGGFMAALLLCGTATGLSAQSKGGARPAFDKGDNTLGFGLGVGNVYPYRGGASELPAFVVHYDHGLVGNVGPGTIGIGGEIGYQSSYYRYGNGYKATHSNFFVGFRGTYHLTILKDKNNKFDPYGGVVLGMRMEAERDEYPGNRSINRTDARPYVGPFVGAKYNFVPSFGAFSELGYGLSFFRIGVHLNF